MQNLSKKLGGVAALMLWLSQPALTAGQSWRPLFNGKNLDGWEVHGEGIWTVMQDGTLLGQRRHAKPNEPFDQPWPISSKTYAAWLYRQAWLYTVEEFGNYDLHVEYWVPPFANSGVSIRDVSRAYYATGEKEPPRHPLPDVPHSTPAHIGYEIQIIDPDNDRYPSGSIYLFQAARQGVQKKAEWNSLDIESRPDHIRVKLNGEAVAESAGDPARPKRGPIGLQLHDQFTFVMFRNIRIRETR